MPLPNAEEAGKNLASILAFLGFVGGAWKSYQAKRGEDEKKADKGKISDVDQLASEREENRRLRAELAQKDVEHDADRDRWQLRIKKAESVTRRLSTEVHDLQIENEDLKK